MPNWTCDRCGGKRKFPIILKKSDEDVCKDCLTENDNVVAM